MSITAPATGRGRLSATAPGFWIGREVDDIPSGWMDHNIKRLFDEWNKQMIKLEDLKNGSNKSDSAKEREHDARTLMQLQRSLDHLIKLETGRAALRANKMANRNEGERAALQRQLDQLTGPRNAPQVSGDDE
ncbi:MAG: hypothetical protein JOZ72_15105 [Alphaproteobacteria bacterium]|nr:hypothetical protein [Alphaproteobacteria bacterium]